jgi:pimeloyl-ACP methyl ester carboxylesterase
MGFANHQGVRIHYRVIGEGPSLVLHHGFMQTLKRWYLCGYVEALRKDYRLILIDPRGHGGSDKPHDPEAYTLPLRVADVVTVLDHLRVEAAVFWGYSNGGRIGFGLAKYAPERVSALIIGGHDPYERRIAPWERFDGSDRNACLDAFLQRINIDPAAVEPARREELLRNDFEALAAAQQDEASLEDVLPLMTMPCLLYAGDVDPFYPAILKCAQSMPNVTVVPLPGLTHSLGFWRSDLVVEQVLKFLRGSVESAKKGA